jgi:hypothetical protein
MVFTPVYHCSPDKGQELFSTACLFDRRAIHFFQFRQEKPMRSGALHLTRFQGGRFRGREHGDS